MFIKKLYKRFLKVASAIPHEIYIFIVAFLYRLPGLGYDFINNDAFHWKERGYAFGSALTSLDFASTAVTYHPGVPLLWCQFVSIKIYSILLSLGLLNSPSAKDEFLINNQIQTTVVVLLTSILIAIMYRQLKRIIGTKLSLITVVLILIEPFYLALARALHTDAMISLFMFISLLYFYNYLSDSKFKRINSDSIFAGLFAGFAFLTKSSALFLFPFFGLVAILVLLSTKSFSVVYKTLVVFGISILTFFVFWPAMWVQPIESVNLYLFKGVQGIAIEEGHEHFWFGKITADPGPLFYPIVLIGRYTPVFFVGLLTSLYLLWSNRFKLLSNRKIRFFGLIVLYSVFYLLMITLVSKKLDRYSLPIVLPLGVLASWVISDIFNKKAVIYFIFGLLIMRGALFYGLHPNYLAYYSPFIGGVRDGRYVIEPKWLVGYDRVAKYFNEKQARHPGQEIKVAIADFDYLRPFADFKVLNIRNEVERNEAEYLVLPAFREERNGFYEEIYKLKKPNAIIKVAGVDYYYIYELDNLREH